MPRPIRHLQNLQKLRRDIRDLHLCPEAKVLDALIRRFGPDSRFRQSVTEDAARLVKQIRQSDSPGLMECFLAEYGLSTREGVALMCLAEALLRVPDTDTIDALIEDKITPSSWGEHLGRSSSSLVNASSWGLMLCGRILKDSDGEGMGEVLHGLVKRLGEPVIRNAVKRAMKEMGHQFVLGRTIGEAAVRARQKEKAGYTYSYDMLGEAALTAMDADGFFAAYANAIRVLKKSATSDDIRHNPGISVKLSALHPRYEVSQTGRVMAELVPRVRTLAIAAKEARMGFNIDAEEADRLDLSLDVIEAVLNSPQLEGWDGFGVVVQAYGKRASAVIDWLYGLSEALDRRIMVRLVKGAYWDTEIKRAQIDGLRDFPVFCKKPATDISYICCAKQLLAMTDRLYPQFATHNAHTVSAIRRLAQAGQPFEFQKLHGMGESMYDLLVGRDNLRCRIYAPVGAHKDLLAYLVRRLLENGANSSFAHQIIDANVPPERIAADPFDTFGSGRAVNAAHIVPPQDIYRPERPNSAGWDLTDRDDLDRYRAARSTYRSHQWSVGPMIAARVEARNAIDVFNPAAPDDQVGRVVKAGEADVEAALSSARNWGDTPGCRRGEVLWAAAELYEENAGEIFAALGREAGKTPPDAVAEIREAVDFLRYYGAHASGISARQAPRGLITCISPWNFPLAIFTGQISAALAAGNGVLAKPADPTPIIASIGVRLMHRAGVPRDVLQFIPGAGAVVGARLTSDPGIKGVCFTGSTEVARTINKTMAENLDPDAMLIAETGGLNAMIVDSTALPEQAVKDIITSAFQSAGQRCSALRLLYLQEDIAGDFLTMLYGAMDELNVGSPWHFPTDIGPVISATARTEIEAYIGAAKKDGRLMKRLKTPEHGLFVGPAVIRVNGMRDLKTEIFGPVLHVATFHPGALDRIVGDINESGFGLTFAMHTRIDDRVEKLSTSLNVGNIYVNRNQIGAVVGSQPFGGEGMSGTGPKAGGPKYVGRFLKKAMVNHPCPPGEEADTDAVRFELNRVKNGRLPPLSTEDLPGPTGESNRLSTFPRGTVLCLGPTRADALKQARIAESHGCRTVVVAPDVSGDGAVPGRLDRGALQHLDGFDVVALWSDEADLRKARAALGAREGPIIALAASADMEDVCLLERHICIDTTASGGNASLLACG